MATEENRVFLLDVMNIEPLPLPRSSHFITAGLRANMIGFYLDLAADIGINSPALEFGPALPPWQILFGAGFSFDPLPKR
jgi:hypothetical protein